MKKLVSLALTFALCLGLCAPALAMGYGQEYAGYRTGGTAQYSDVPYSHWAYPSIETCSQRGWFNGYPDGTFHPGDYIRRDEAAKVFAMALGLTLEQNPTPSYTDTSDSWAKAYIEATRVLFPNAANLQGTASFRPTQTITREETVYALVVAWRYASKTTNADLSILNMFSDQNSISAGVKPYVAVAVSEGLVSGLPDGTIAAQKGLTRAEFAALLARALSHGYGPDVTDAPTITLDAYPAQTYESQVALTGKITPASGATLTVNGEEVPLGSGGTFRAVLNLEEGSNTFALTAVNAYGVSSYRDVTVERVPEEVSIRLLSSIPVESEAEQLTVNGKVVNWSGDCLLLVNETRAAADGEGYFELTLSLQPGDNRFELTVLRAQREVAHTSIQIFKPEAEPEPEPEAPALPTFPDPNRTVVARGDCGENLNWALYGDGELAIVGTGKMDDYLDGSIQDAYSNAPWRAYQNQIKSVVIGSGVTGIGDCAFSRCTYLKSVTIPNSVSTIGEAAFSRCSLVEVALPDSITTIEDYTFSWCPLTNIIIPNSVSLIGKAAFYRCQYLGRAAIPNSVTTIGEYAFDHCISLTGITIPDSVTEIGEGAFAGCSSLTSVTIPDSVTVIEQDTFSSCGQLAHVTMPDSITDIRLRAFCGCTSLTSVTIPSGITSIDGAAFASCSRLTSVTIPKSVTIIWPQAFDGCHNLSNVYYTGSPEEWSSISISSGNAPLTSATIHYNA